MNRDSKIYVAGHNGLVGSAILSKLRKLYFTNTIVRSHYQLDLTNTKRCNEFFKCHKPEYVFLAAAKVGGIKANSENPVEFFTENMMIEMNVIRNCYEHNVKKLIYLGSSCIYPKGIDIPIGEHRLLSDKLEPTNEMYALAKISGIKLCESYNKQYGTNFLPVMPCSLFGKNDNFDLNNSHLIPALMRKMHEAKLNGMQEVEIWGTGTPLREFLYVDDLVEAILFLIDNYKSNDLINIGSGVDHEIAEIAEKIKRVVGYQGDLVFNPDKPDGVKKKLLNSSKINKLGWYPKYSLTEGLKKTYGWYQRQLYK